ncbi:MAG: hypothetical protein ACI8RZ_004066 [Myxococcota bacterium]|jgi:hypothetical protein
MAPLFLLTLSCVVRYGEPVGTLVNQEIPAPVSFSEIDTRIGVLLDNEQDIDRLDRLTAARDLASQMKDQEPATQQVVLDYLTVLVEVEERSTPMSLWPGEESEVDTLITMPEIEEEVLDREVLDESASDGPPVEPEALRAAPAESGTAAMITVARSLIDTGDPYVAMQTLEECREKLCWTEVAGLWSDARDLYVYERREEAAEQFLSARQEPDTAERMRQLREVEVSLSKLLSLYPNTRYGPAIQQNVALVQDELTALIEQ